MKKVRLTENELIRIIEKIIKEDLGGMDDSHPVYGKMNLKKDLGRSGRLTKPTHPDLSDLFNKGQERFDADSGVDVFTPDDDIEDDFDFEDSELAEMKRKVRVMENKLKRKKQLRRK